MAVVIFDPNAFRSRYPQFATVSDAVLIGSFNDGMLYLNNTDQSPIQDITRRTSLLWMLTAHIAYLQGAGSDDGQARPVGRLSSASEGSVSATFTGPAAGTGDWFTQTAWGAAFWQATLGLRSATYLPQPTDIYSNNRPFGSYHPWMVGVGPDNFR